jgi:uncharacterized protein (TIGR03000 family)
MSTYQSFYPSDAAPAGNTALLRIRTQPDAQLWFDDTMTTQSGPFRTFTTPELQPGKQYEYQLKVRYMENGKEVQKTKTVDVAAGKAIDVDLTPASLK